jgi:hypothetical protein
MHCRTLLTQQHRLWFGLAGKHVACTRAPGSTMPSSSRMTRGHHATAAKEMRQPACSPLAYTAWFTAKASSWWQEGSAGGRGGGKTDPSINKSVYGRNQLCICMGGDWRHVLHQRMMHILKWATQHLPNNAMLPTWPIVVAML